MTAKASARKSLGEYKPLIVYPEGRTEVCEQSPERFDRYTKQGVIKGQRMARGNTYATREEAIAAAQAVIDARRDEAISRYNKYSNHPLEKIRAMAERVAHEVETWGGFPDKK